MDTPSTQPAAQLLEKVLNTEERPMPDQPNTPNVLTLGENAEQPMSGIKEEILKEQIVDALRTVYDPEIPVNIYELGLIYEINVHPSGDVDVKMTLTSPACPVAGTLPIEVENKVAAVPGVQNVNLELVWDPPFSIEMMSEAARLQLGLL